jgi:hypothetical protein
MEFIAASKSGFFRAGRAADVGEIPGITGKHPYLRNDEASILIQTILDWEDIRTQPRVADLPLLVFISLFY